MCGEQMTCFLNLFFKDTNDKPIISYAELQINE